ncbi:putative F-box protein PP2-B12 [Brachypodium distachyon]|uniref:putative F-box protein PP2-B12 n=1 Tax=Brachypodium distachyon TaxID=15368 RepID=UPI00053005C3|nr:putative F-box protein PP2-B12 [Brachypodium distachyon]|eukprot:XP_024317243.1 putative F-box protein PP2-B12 [Brachypodium distachyon]
METPAAACEIDRLPEELLPSPASCEIARLPDDLLATIITLTSPRDACRAAAVSRAFRAAADSDDVWSRFLPRDLPRFVDSTEISLSMTPSSKKERFLRLSDHPALLLGRVTSMWLDKFTGGKCYTLSARALDISSAGDEPDNWRWTHADVLRDVKTGERNPWQDTEEDDSNYVAYMVFKLAGNGTGAHGLHFPYQEASVSVGGGESTWQLRACLDAYDDDGAFRVVPRNLVQRAYRDWPDRGTRDVYLPCKRADGWMELELGKFCSEEEGSDDDEVCVALTETKFLKPKGGLIVRSIEIRIKQ